MLQLRLHLLKRYRLRFESWIQHARGGQFDGQACPHRRAFGLLVWRDEVVEILSFVADCWGLGLESNRRAFRRVKSNGHSQHGFAIGGIRFLPTIAGPDAFGSD